MRPDRPPGQTRSMSIDFATVTDPDTDWSAVDAHLDEAGVNAVELSAGRIEFTAFDWAAHPDAAAEPGIDHLARAARGVQETADGSTRQIGLIVDAYAPNWLADHPGAAGVAADGERGTYQASASELTSGEVGRRLVAYVGALAERYDPSLISISELFLSEYSFGTDDRELYTEMTGHPDWPRTPDGEIAESDPSILAWRAEVIAGLLQRMRDAMDAARDGEGTRIDLVMEVRVDWQDPARGALESGHDYEVLLGPADRLLLWAYLYGIRHPVQIRRVLGAVDRAGVDMGRLGVSVGLWRETPGAEQDEPISVPTFRSALRAADSHGVTSVNVTPFTLMSDRYWTALAEYWNPEGDR